MTNPDLQETIEEVQERLARAIQLEHGFDVSFYNDILTLLKAQQELEELSSICPDCGCRRYIPWQESSDE